MLVNLLIAMFGKRYEEVEKDALGFWRQQNHSLFWEFKNRTWFPPPLSWIEFVLWKFTRVENLCCYTAFKDKAYEDVPPNASSLEQFQELETEMSVKYCFDLIHFDLNIKLIKGNMVLLFQSPQRDFSRGYTKERFRQTSLENDESENTGNT